ncbi:MAG: DUF3471 domain-containing protein, partial [Steroidobacteraceae bacterium]|nr:DUF3471 domain-containing protein [Steroidobacteraceae bacterium]
IAALAGVSLTLTALAAQVSPPNSGTVTVESTDKAGGKKPGERVAIKLPAATLDRYSGTWKMSEQMYIDVKREGDKLMAKLTGQPSFEVFAEREDYFFWKIVDAQLEFNDGGHTAELHQFGKNFPLTRVDASEATLAQSALDARIASQTPQPGSEAALRLLLDGMMQDKIDYGSLEPLMADALRQQDGAIKQVMKQLGPVTKFTFKSVGHQGWDMYEVQHANGRINYLITLAPNGKIGGFMQMMTP